MTIGSNKIFVSAYACEPGLGSEIGVGWHWVLEMSRQFDLWVLTRESNRHSIEPWIEAHPEFANIHFLYFDLPKWARFWKKGLRGVRLYYNIWQRLTNRIVKKTMQTNDIKIFHHLTYGNALWPVSDYGSRQTFVWGPVGGLETIPEEYTRYYDRKSRIIEMVRRFAVNRSVKSRAFKRRCNRADLILCKTESTMELLPASAREHAVLFTDVATESTACRSDVAHENDGTLRCVAVGRLDAWRGFDLAIEAIAKASVRHPDLNLTIVGKGADRCRLESLVGELRLEDKVTFTGAVDIQEYQRIMQQADIVLNPALKEGAVTVAFDAMAMGKPLVAINTGGYTRYFSPEYSRVIPRRPRAEVINDLADAIVMLADDDLRCAMGRNARDASASFSWEKHGEEICKVIRQTIDGE